MHQVQGRAVHPASSGLRLTPLPNHTPGSPQPHTECAYQQGFARLLRSEHRTQQRSLTLSTGPMGSSPTTQFPVLYSHMLRFCMSSCGLCCSSCCTSGRLAVSQAQCSGVLAVMSGSTASSGSRPSSSCGGRMKAWQRPHRPDRQEDRWSTSIRGMKVRVALVQNHI